MKDLLDQLGGHKLLTTNLTTDNDRLKSEIEKIDAEVTQI